MIVLGKILYNDIKEEIESFSQLIKKVELFDVYEGGGLGKNKKNLAFHIVYQAEDRTLSSKEIDQIQSKIIKALEKNQQWEVRR